MSLLETLEQFDVFAMLLRVITATTDDFEAPFIPPPFSV